MARIVYGVVGAALATLVAGFFIQDSTLPLLVSIGFSLVAAVLILTGWARRIRLEDEVLFDEEPNIVWDDDEPFSEPEDGDRTTEISARSNKAVVIIPGRARYHTSECRFASNPSAETVKEREAVARGFEPCSVCNA
jgi:hypothetical protein